MKQPRVESNKNTKSLQQVSDNETAVILDELRKILASKIEGDVVEFGCYKGDTSLLMERTIEREFPGSTSRLWIYDSFEGLPEKTREDNSSAGESFKAGELLVSKREVVERFKKAGLKVPRVRKGFFEELDPGDVTSDGEILRSSNDLPDKICFAFLDGDLYQSIRTSLKLVAPRMVRDESGKICGVILIHDYDNPQLPGVTKAVDEWLAQQNVVRRETTAQDATVRKVTQQKTAPQLQRRESLAIISW